MLALILAIATGFSPVRTTVSDANGAVHLALIPTEGGNGVLHMRICGRRVSRRVAQNSISATTKSIHKCTVCTVVADFTECSNVSPLSLPVTARFVLTHPEIKQIMIIAARGPVGLAVRTVQRLCGGKFEIYRSFAAFARAAGDRIAPLHRRTGLNVAKSNMADTSGLLKLDLGVRLRSAFSVQQPAWWHKHVTKG
jgi:hypothetical protein